MNLDTAWGILTSMALEEIHEWNHHIFDEKLRTELLPEEEAEIKRFEAEISNLEKGALDPDDFGVSASTTASTASAAPRTAT